IKKQCEELKEKLSSLSLTIPALTQGEDELYGSIGAVEICAALKDEGLDIDKGCIVLAQPLKAVGIFEVPVKLHPEINAKVKVWIVKK
ncbi:50S ribosomal L9 C-terminal domain-containing protein, partial [Candidatus Omnitrophota bacterium]